MVPGFTGLPKEAEPGSGKRTGCKSSSAKDFIGSYLDIHSVRQSKLELLNHHSYFSFSALNSCKLGYILSVNLYKTVKSLCTSNMGHL